MLFINNKYTKWYNSIIQTAQTRSAPVIVEQHHIIPKSLGGNNNLDNFVALTPREHYICHLLLTKMLHKPQVFSMTHAIWRMANSTTNQKKGYKISSRSYELLRAARKNICMSPESKLKLSQSKKALNRTPWNKGIPRTPEEKSKISSARISAAKDTVVWNKGKPHSAETLQKIAEKAKSRVMHTCPYCGKNAAGSNYSRWHGANCKYITLL